jgi:kinesin family protein 6/9
MASGQDNAVKVFIRTKPTTKFADPNIKIDEDKGDIMITIPKKDEQGYVNHQQEHWAFKFDKILRNVSQEILFGMTVKDMVLGSLDGYSGTLICYGQTGAGKTFSTLGYEYFIEDRSLITSIEVWCREPSRRCFTRYKTDSRS